MSENVGLGPFGLWLEGAWLKLLYRLNRGYLWVTVDDLRLYGILRHQKLLYRLQKGSFERFTRQLFRRAVRPDSIVVDVGAHVGYYTLIAARGVGTEGRVVAFECDPANHRFLLHNLRVNRMARNVTVIPMALADRSGSLPFFPDEKDSSGSSVWSGDGGVKDGLVPPGTTSSMEVRCTTLDDTMGDSAVHLVKIDIEGGELRALRGMERTLGRSAEVVLFVECNPSALAAAGASPAELLAELGRQGFDVQAIDDDERTLKPVSALGSIQHYANLYCTKRSRGGGYGVRDDLSGGPR